MKPDKNMEKQIKNFQIKINDHKDKFILNELLIAHAQSKTDQFAPMIWKFVRISSSIAVAGLVIFLFTKDVTEPKKQIVNVTSFDRTRDPAELMTFASLHNAFSKGGTDAIENQFSHALKLIGPAPTNFSNKELFND